MFLRAKINIAPNLVIKDVRIYAYARSCVIISPDVVCACHQWGFEVTFEKQQRLFGDQAGSFGNNPCCHIKDRSKLNCKIDGFEG